MNICLTCNSSPWAKEYAGDQIVTHNLATQFTRMGHHVFVVYTTCEEIVPPPDINYEIIWVRDVGKYRMRYRALNIFPVAKAVHELMSRTHIDVIQGAVSEAVPLPFLARRHKCVFTMVIHRPYYPKMNSAKFLLRPDKCLLEHLCFMEWFAFAKAHRVFSVSAYTKDHVVENLGLRPEKIEVVYNGFDSEFFDVQRESISTNGTEMVFHGRLNPQKGVDTLLKALAITSRQLDGTKKLHLNIVGRGPWEREYRELAQSLGISQSVSFPGWMSVDQMAELFSKASLSILPTRTESFALNIGEAMAAGVPIISTNIDSVPEIITDGKTGLLVPPDNPEALAEKMLYAIAHPAEMEANARVGRKWVRDNFTWERVAAKYAHAYEELLNT